MLIKKKKNRPVLLSVLPPMENDDANPEPALMDEPEITEEPNTGSPTKIENDVDQIKQAFGSEIEDLRGLLAEEQARSRSLEEEIREMREAFAAALAARDETASQEISELRASIAKIENATPPAPQRSEIDEAFQYLNEAVAEGIPFESQLAVVARYAPEASAIAFLRPYAASGVITAELLQADMPEAVRAALDAGSKTSGGLGARLGGLFGLRPAVPQEGDTPSAILSRAEAHTARRDFQQALAEIKTLPPTMQEAMRDWTTQAEAHVNALSALNTLKQQLAQAGR